MTQKEQCPNCGSRNILMPFAFAPNECEDCGHKWNMKMEEI